MAAARLRRLFAFSGAPNRRLPVGVRPLVTQRSGLPPLWCPVSWRPMHTLVPQRYSQWRAIALPYFGGNPEGGEIAVRCGLPMSSFALEALRLDQGGTPYWSVKHEMAARRFNPGVRSGWQDLAGAMNACPLLRITGSPSARSQACYGNLSRKARNESGSMPPLTRSRKRPGRCHRAQHRNVR